MLKFKLLFILITLSNSLLCNNATKNNTQNHTPKIAFISAIYGPYEATCRPFAPQTISADFICFSNLENIKANGWTIDRNPYHLTHPNPIDTGTYLNSLNKNKHTFNIAKYYKQSFHMIPKLQAYDVVVWLDGSIEITNPKTAACIIKKIKENPIITMEHPAYQGNLANEVASSHFERYTSTFWFNQPQPYQDVDAQYQAYIRDGYNEKCCTRETNPLSGNPGLWMTCLVAFDQHNPNVKNFLDLWYMQTLQYTTQDQIGFPYTVQKLNMHPYTLPDEEIRGNVNQNDLYYKHCHGNVCSSIKTIYEDHCKYASHINQQLPELHKLTSLCQSVLEIGSRGTTPNWGILSGLAYKTLAKDSITEKKAIKASFLCFDSKKLSDITFHLAKGLAEGCEVIFNHMYSNDMLTQIKEIPIADMLFFDTIHTYCHTMYTLEKFSLKINKYIAIHCTSGPFCINDDPEYTGDRHEYPTYIDRTKRGVWTAIQDFLTEHPEWELHERDGNCFGLTVLKRIARPDLSLDEYLALKGFDFRNKFVGEGYMSQDQQKQFTTQLATYKNINNVLEIGLNAGHSANNFFKQLKSLKKFVSFDLNHHAYTPVAAEYLQSQHPNMFTFIPGDSKVTIPAFAAGTHDKFDLIYVDGDHSYEGCKKDIENCKKLAHRKTILWIDDYFDPVTEYSFGVKHIVDDMVKQGVIEIINVHRAHDNRCWVEAQYLLGT